MSDTRDMSVAQTTVLEVAEIVRVAGTAVPGEGGQAMRGVADALVRKANEIAKNVVERIN